MPVDVDDLMCGLAKRRAAVRLRDGKTVRLVAWKPRYKMAHARKRNYMMRVEYPGGGRATLPIAHLDRILDDGKEPVDRTDLLHA